MVKVFMELMVVANKGDMRVEHSLNGVVQVVWKLEILESDVILL